MPEQTHQHLWTQHASQPTDQTRDALIIAHLPLAKSIANRYAERVPRYVGREDLQSVAQIGLMDAIRTFDPDRGVRFETHARRRIIGEMIEEIRRIDWLPRLARERRSKAEAIREAWIARTGMTPTTDELREAMGVRCPRTWANVAEEIANCEMRQGSEEDPEDPATHDDPIAEMESREEFDRLTAPLSDDQRRVVECIYVLDLPAERGMTMTGMVESTYYHHRRLALEAMKAALQPQ